MKRKKLDHEGRTWDPADYEVLSPQTSRSEISSDEESERVIEVTDMPSVTHKRQRLDHVRASDLVYPKSQYAGWTPPLPVTLEQEAIECLKVIF